MSSASIIAIATALASLAGAITALIKVIQHTKDHQSNQPVSLPHADTERADQRDVPMGFSPPESRA